LYGTMWKQSNCAAGEQEGNYTPSEKELDKDA
jgi:hypothetical protein